MSDTTAMKIWIDLVVAGTVAGETIAKDPQNVGADLGALFPLVGQFQAAYPQWSAAVADAKAIDQAGMDDLVAYVQAKVPTIASASATIVVDGALKLLDIAFGLYKALHG